MNLNRKMNKQLLIRKTHRYLGIFIGIQFIGWTASGLFFSWNDIDELPLSQSTISQHLKELKQIGIIKGEVEGPKLNYCIDERVWEEARDIFINMFSRFTPNNCC